MSESFWSAEVDQDAQAGPTADLRGRKFYRHQRRTTKFEGSTFNLKKSDYRRFTDALFSRNPIARYHDVSSDYSVLAGKFGDTHFRSTMLLVSTCWRVVLVGVLISSVVWLFIFRESLGGLSGLGYAPQVIQANPDVDQPALPEPTNTSVTPLVLYAYAESETARDNLKFFLEKGLHGGADFIFIFNGETDAFSLVPEHPNVKVIRRENKCFDLGAIGEVLRKEDLWKRYKRFITMNASIKGPFLPRYDRTSCWSDIFLDRVTETVKLVGTTVNCQPSPHLQSMLWATDSIGMGILLDPELARSVPEEDHWGTVDDPVGLSFCHETMDAAVHSELGSTRLITSQGYKVDALMTAYELSAGSYIEDYCKLGQFEDILYEKKYYGSNIHPYETIFFKSNRGIDPILLRKLTDWHLKNGVTSWDICK